jgi:hypothetical protein
VKFAIALRAALQKIKKSPFPWQALLASRNEKGDAFAAAR